MAFRLPFFGMLQKKSPMAGLLIHFEKVQECVAFINGSLECHMSATGSCSSIRELATQIDELEKEAEQIKRNIRNHLPRSYFLAVDKELFFRYTNYQDNIMDSAQNALHWLAMRPIAFTPEVRANFIHLLSDVMVIMEQLGNALEITIELVEGKSLMRNNAKQEIWEVRDQRGKIRKLADKIKRDLMSAENEKDFKDIYQAIHFVQCLEDMSSNCEACADILRVMIAH